MKCASCGNEIEYGRLSAEHYFNKYGQYCLNCNARISRRSHKPKEEDETKSEYQKQLEKSKKNDLIWRKKGYL